MIRALFYPGIDMRAQATTTGGTELKSTSANPHPHDSNGAHIQEPASDVDSVLEASRVADTAVPEGGYGWVVVAGLTVVAWWVCSK